MSQKTYYYTAGIIILIIGGGMSILLVHKHSITSSQPLTSTHMSSLSLTSSAFTDNGSIPTQYTCDADPAVLPGHGDINPPLDIAGVPDGAKSLVLIVDDPDAPRGTWTHWVVFNIPPTLAHIEEGTQPEGIAGNYSWPKKEYGGPCPPSGEHHYIFKLYALDSNLDLPEGTTKTEVETAMEGHILEQTQLIGRYSRINKE